MSKEQLEVILKKVEQELKELDPADDEVRGRLAELSQVVHEVREQVIKEKDPSQLHGRLRDAAQRFQDSHPTLSLALGQASDVLAAMGI